ncbi:hypothetical protein [Caldivirga sp. UBA161]|nr:hypothetical protein [Caldivirga sp. UBA161]
MSLSRGLTFYDAGYAYTAESMALVTNDKRILKSTSNATSFMEFAK